MTKKSVLLIGLLLVMLISSSCSFDASIENNCLDSSPIKLMITKNFGHERLLFKEINYKPNMSVMDVLIASDLEVDTRYGGSFVNGIDGLTSTITGTTGERQDWFYFVNGIFADVGALDYSLQSGEVVWWDYRPWQTAFGNSTAVIGSFPETFQYGYLGKISKTYIMCYSEYFEDADKLREKLKNLGVRDVEVIHVDENRIEQREGPTILLGEWEKINKIDYIRNLNDNYRKTGVWAYYAENKMHLLDYRLQTVEVIEEKAGLITAFGQGSGDSYSIWLVSGLDQEGVQGAVSVLTNNCEALLGSYNAAVVDGQILRLPFMER